MQLSYKIAQVNIVVYIFKEMGQSNMANKYIDINDFALEINKQINNPAIRSWLFAIINDMPSADVKKVTRGKWQRMQNYARCSNCKHEVNWGNDDFLSPYCPVCGAAMELLKNFYT